MVPDEKNEIKAVLVKFQEGYIKRDITLLESYINDLFVKDEDVCIIGTSAVHPGGYEWCTSIEEVKKLISDDWKTWGDLRMDIDNTLISINENTAWVALKGTVSKTDDLPLRITAVLVKRNKK